MDKQVYLGLSILELSKIYAKVLVWCKTKIWQKSKILLYGYRHSFIVYIKADDVYKDIAKNFEARFDTSN